MARPKGVPNADREGKRQELVDRLRSALLSETPPSSYRSLAGAAGVTIPTLRHYFGDREGVIAAVFADCHQGASHHLQATRQPNGKFSESVQTLLEHVADGFLYGGLTELHSVGLIEGLADGGVAKAYLAEVLEPTLQAVEQRLLAHIKLGEMRKLDARVAALQLVSPVLIYFLHQDGLGGKDQYELDLHTLIKQHGSAFIRAYATAHPGARNKMGVKKPPT